MPLDLLITNEQKVHVKLAPKTAGGKDAALDGAPLWEVLSGSGTIVPDADGLGAFLVSPDAIDGVPTVYKVSADADLGSGVITLEDTINLTTNAANAANFGLVAEAPVAK